ncbi:hypothetical protein Tco_1094693 [Tanacetum coccineum]|uniref:Uncharacterized protein n=1 Tax=Tanacetum coccineum TaxID=301880 RepID=A0ABQ5IGM7_9ASTR
MPGVTTFIACSSLLILVVAIVVVGIGPTISGSMAIPLAFSTLGCTLPSMVVIALGAQRLMQHLAEYRYVVPTGKDNVIVSAGRTNVIPAGSTILVLVVLCLLLRVSVRVS